MRATGLSFDQLEAMDGADFGALASDLKDSPPLNSWLPQALAHIICLWGGGKRIDQMMSGWGFKSASIDVSDEDARFIAALNKR